MVAFLMSTLEAERTLAIVLLATILRRSVSTANGNPLIIKIAV